MTIRQYRKKPVVIEAVQYTGDNIIDVTSFAQHALDGLHSCGGIIIKTLEDGKNGQVKHVASEGDYIIKGIQGEFYPCKPDIFKATYEAVGYDD